MKTKKQIHKEVDELLDKFYFATFDIVYDMYVNADITSKQEIKAILVRDVRSAVDAVFEENFE